MKGISFDRVPKLKKMTDKVAMLGAVPTGMQVWM